MNCLTERVIAAWYDGGMRLLRGVALATLVLAGCGGSVISADNASGGSAGTGGAVGTGGSGGTGGGAGAGAVGGSAGFDAGSPVCQAAANKLADELGGAASSCTVAVRLSSSFAIQGYAVFCSGYAKPDEATARNQAQTDTGLTYGCSPAPSLTGSQPGDEFVFLEPATAAACACCGDGWVAAVSARNGLTVFGQPLLMGAKPDGKGYPAIWKPASDLASHCPAPAPLPSARGFDFAGFSSQGAKLDDASIHSALEAVWQTALPAAYAKKQYIFDAVVLRSAGTFMDSVPADYIVLVNSGWLE